MRGAFGRVPSRHDPRTLRLANYMDAGAIDAPPPARDWIGSTKFSWFLNQKMGTCGVASLCHMLQAHSAQTGRPITITDADVITAYSGISGYIPGHPETDHGIQMMDGLRYMKSVGIAGIKLGAYVKVNPQNQLEMRSAINLFGGVYVGAELPNRISTQVVWDYPPIAERGPLDRAGSMGGHAFTFLRFDRLHLGLATWAATYAATNDWVDFYCDEAWALISPSWVTGDDRAPNGFDIDRLKFDLSAL